MAAATCATMHRWRPLRTARFRLRWTKRGPGCPACGGSGAPRRGPCRGKGDPRRLPPTSEPRLGDRLVRGSPGGVWARDIPLYRRAVPGHRHGGPQHPACSNHADDGGCLDDMEPRGRSVVVSRSWCAAAGEVGFEPPRVAPPGPKLRRSCGSWWYPGRCQPAQQERCPSAVPARSPSSRRLSAGPVSKFVSIGVGRLEPGTARPRPASSPCRPCALGRRARKQGDRERWSGEC
jgi:hypothetical protein